MRCGPPRAPARSSPSDCPARRGHQQTSTRSGSQRRGPRIPDLGRTAVKTNQSDSHRVSFGGLSPYHFVICLRIDEILIRRRRGVQVSGARDQCYSEA